MADNTYEWDIPDGSYRATDKNGNASVIYLVRFFNRKSYEAVAIEDKIYRYSAASSFWKEWGYYYPATFDEQQYLAMCLSAGRLVTLPSYMYIDTDPKLRTDWDYPTKLYEIF